MALASSRYDLMEDTINLDETGLDTYPDPLAFFEKLEKFPQSEPPIQFEADTAFVRKPYLSLYQYYQDSYKYDDIVLFLNSIPYISTLEENRTVYIPAFRDMIKFYTQYSTIGGTKL